MKEQAPTAKNMFLDLPTTVLKENKSEKSDCCIAFPPNTDIKNYLAQ